MQDEEIEPCRSRVFIGFRSPIEGRNGSVAVVDMEWGYGFRVPTLLSALGFEYKVQLDLFEAGRTCHHDYDDVDVIKVEAKV